MKKLILVLAVLMVTPAFAGVEISAAKDAVDCNSLIVSYDATSLDPNLVRAFALDLNVEYSATIKEIVDVNGNYNIYPGSIDIDESVGVVIDYGTAVASDSYPGTLPGLDTNGVTTEMGSLENVPGATGVLMTINLDGANRGCVTISENAIRGGIVLEDPDIAAASNLPIEICGGCQYPGDCGWALIGGFADGQLSVNDVSFIGAFIQMNGGTAANGWVAQAPTPPEMECGDVDSDGVMTVNDVSWIGAWIQMNGGTPGNGWVANSPIDPTVFALPPM